MRIWELLDRATLSPYRFSARLSNSQYHHDNVIYRDHHNIFAAPAIVAVLAYVTIAYARPSDRSNYLAYEWRQQKQTSETTFTSRYKMCSRQILNTLDGSRNNVHRNIPNKT